MPAPIVLSTLTPETKKVVNPPEGQPVIATKADLRDGSRPTDPVDPAPSQGLIFSESFDDLPDTTSNTGITTELSNAGWTDSRQGGDAGGPHYTPDKGFPDGHYPWEIAADTDKVRGGTGKALVCRRESYSLLSGDPGWNSDGQLYADLGQQYDELFARFWIKFQPGWTKGGQSKLFRALHYDGSSGRFNNFPDGANAPLIFWDYNHNSFGLRNVLAFRGAPQGSNYYFTEQGIPNLPRSMNSGDLTLNFNDNLRDLDGDGIDENPVTLIDLTTGSPLEPGTIQHEQVYGDEFFKVEFHLKMNSAPGVEDGVFRQWVRDQLIFSNTTVPWLGPGATAGIGWNAFALGGNDRWNEFPNSEAAQQWYAIDDFELYDSLPEDMQ